MEQVYDLGISVIQFVQYQFSGNDEFFKLVNNVSNPHSVLEYLFPLMSIVDSVFAAQLLLCMSFGGWLNAVLKWWFLEDRPYWWVQETDYYLGTQRPVVRQTSQTCETGPGSPSGHTESTAMLMVLFILWASHILRDRKLVIVGFLHYLVYLGCGVALGSVMLARLYVGTHFPHQVLLGAIVGAILAPALCIYIVDPFVWRRQSHAHPRVSETVVWHCLMALATVTISVATYFALKLLGWDPHGTVKLAFRWCQQPETIHVSTTPMFASVHATGHLLGWALAVTPDIAVYRHDTKNRSIMLATFSSCILTALWTHLQENVPQENAFIFYTLQYFLCALKPALMLRLVPYVAMWPYGGKEKVA